tara:strand:- start:1875 stop:2024 length:150 start_codon:yes stop_codon:yes gene_type:complete
MSYGFTTKILQNEFIKLNDIKVSPEVITLNGHENNSDRLYFWQSKEGHA